MSTDSHLYCKKELTPYDEAAVIVSDSTPGAQPLPGLRSAIAAIGCRSEPSGTNHCAAVNSLTLVMLDETSAFPMFANTLVVTRS